MSEFKINTGVSEFSIYLPQTSECRSYSVSFGDFDNLVDVSVDNWGRIVDVDCISVAEICQKEIELPDRETLRCYFSPYGPPEEDGEYYGWPLWINLHPEKRELNILLYTSSPQPEYCFEDGRIELYYRKADRYNEDTDEFDTVDLLECIRVLDLTDEEYAYLKRFCKE